MKNRLTKCGINMVSKRNLKCINEKSVTPKYAFSDEVIEYSTTPKPITSDEDLEVLRYMMQFEGAEPSDLWF